MKSTSIPGPSLTAAPHTATKQRVGPWQAPNHVVTFVRCLRLLNLDLLEDWPGVTEQIFSTRSTLQNLQQRIKCVEWSLYRLFEIYDQDGTSNVGRWREVSILSTEGVLETAPFLSPTYAFTLVEPTCSLIPIIDRTEEKWHPRQRYRPAQDNAR